MRYVDANVFIYLLKASPRDAFEVSLAIMRRIYDGEEALTSTAVLQEVVDWLEYNGKKGEVSSFLTGVNSYPTLAKEAVYWGEMISAIDLMEHSQIDYVDAVTVEIMRRNGIEEIYSNDKDFDRVAGIRRIWE